MLDRGTHTGITVRSATVGTADGVLVGTLDGGDVINALVVLDTTLNSDTVSIADAVADLPPDVPVTVVTRSFDGMRHLVDDNGENLLTVVSGDEPGVEANIYTVQTVAITSLTVDGTSG